MNTITLVVLIVSIAFTGFLIWWLFIESEGVYLGKRVVIWLYDVYARRYDNIKAFDETFEHAFLAQPIMSRLGARHDPLILDIAIGTGRLPLALLNHIHYEGHVIGIDLSRKMLAIAAQKLDELGYRDEADLICQTAEKLPFDDATFDMVACLEALEFMPQPEPVLAEMCRVLRPGGMLLTTNRIATRWMPGKLLDREQLTALLEANDIESIKFEKWQVDYDKVWGRKHGESAFVGAQPLDMVLRCPMCNENLMVYAGDSWRCESCQVRVPIAEDGVIELSTL